MKRLFILIAVCMIGMVLPQGMWADYNYSSPDGKLTISVVGKTVTIHSDRAGALDALDFNCNNNKALKDAITAANDKIIYEGYFCEGDLNKLKGGNGQGNAYNCYTQKVVDMSKAHFVNDGGDESNHTDNYTAMKFENWGSNVEVIITSKYATGMMASQLCNNCSNLTTLTLSSGAFNELGNNVNSLATVNVLKDVTRLGNNMFKEKSNLTTLTFEDGGEESLTIGNSCFYKCTGLTGTISLPKRISEIGADAFKETTGIEEVKFNEPSNLTTIHGGTFAESGIKRVTIPKSVTLIESGAFQGNADKNSGKYTRLEEVTFQGGNSTPLIIQTNAFQNCVEIKNVYVNVKPSDRLLVCEYNAFDYRILVSQTQIDGPSAVLHFIEDDFNYYAGEWKKGMAFNQANLNTIKDGIPEDVTINGTTYIKGPSQNSNLIDGGFAQIDTNGDGYYHPSDYPNKQYAPGNGWQQFAKTASEREVYLVGNVYMTYSTDKACSLPEGIIAFRVADYVETGTDANGKTINGMLVLRMIKEVPEHTGMLLISTNKYIVENESQMTKFYFGDPSEENLPEYPYLQGSDDEDDITSNYLAPAVHGIAVGPVSGAPIPDTGVIDINARPFTHRNFILRKSDHWFVRTTKGTMPDNRAFLSLPIGKFTNDNESDMEGPLPWNTQAGKALTDYDPTQASNNDNNAKTYLFFEYDVEEYGMIWPLIKDEGPSGITTGIKNMNLETVQEGIYTLQGVKVSAPSTKGIYIVNGKKVIIK